MLQTLPQHVDWLATKMTTAGSIAAEKYSKMGCRSWLTLLSCRHTRRFQNPLRFLALSSLTVLLLSRGPTTQILMAHVHAHQYNVTNRDKNLIYSQLFLGESDDHYQIRLSLKMASCSRPFLLSVRVSRGKRHLNHSMLKFSS